MDPFKTFENDKYRLIIKNNVNTLKRLKNNIIPEFINSMLHNSTFQYYTLENEQSITPHNFKSIEEWFNSLTKPNHFEITKRYCLERNYPLFKFYQTLADELHNFGTIAFPLFKYRNKEIKYHLYDENNELWYEQLVGFVWHKPTSLKEIDEYLDLVKEELNKKLTCLNNYLNDTSYQVLLYEKATNTLIATKNDIYEYSSSNQFIDNIAKALSYSLDLDLTDLKEIY